MDNPTFEQIMLLLTTALGLSFMVERLLEMLNGLIKKTLLADDSPFSEEATAVKPVATELEIEKMNEALDEEAEALAEKKVALAAETGLSDEEKAKREAALEEQTLEKVALFSKRTEALLGDKPHPAHREALEKLRDELDQAQQTKGLAREQELEENYPVASVLLERLEPRNAEKTAQAFWLQIIGTFAGIVVCFYARFGLFSGLGIFSGVAAEFDWILTGILIGAGSKPIHVLIKFLDQRKVVDMQMPSPGPAAPPASAPPVSVPSPPLIDVPYDGGVDRERLESRRKRKKDPTLIVFHHTALHSDKSFEDVVRVIKSRKTSSGQHWKTGYHCVVLNDGSIHPFCRWDRPGNQAYGVNNISLGVTLNGNFESNPDVPGSNPDGRFGLQKPTDAQVRSAAKVVALWCHLYDIDVAFGSSIIPHKEVPGASTACPGSNFPYEEFEKLVGEFYTEWAKPQAQQELDQYKKKPFIYTATA